MDCRDDIGGCVLLMMNYNNVVDQQDNIFKIPEQLHSHQPEWHLPKLNFTGEQTVIILAL